MFWWCRWAAACAHFLRSHGRVRSPRQRSLEEPQGAKHLSQNRGGLRVAGRELLDVGPLAALLAPQELVGHLAYQRLQNDLFLDLALRHDDYSSNPWSDRAF